MCVAGRRAVPRKVRLSRVAVSPYVALAYIRLSCRGTGLRTPSPQGTGTEGFEHGTNGIGWRNRWDRALEPMGSGTGTDRIGETPQLKGNPAFFMNLERAGETRSPLLSPLFSKFL